MSAMDRLNDTAVLDRVLSHHVMSHFCGDSHFSRIFWLTFDLVELLLASTTNCSGRRPDHVTD